MGANITVVNVRRFGTAVDCCPFIGEIAVEEGDGSSWLTQLAFPSHRSRTEGRLIFACRTLQPSGMNIDFNFVWTLEARYERFFNIIARILLNGNLTDEGTAVPERLTFTYIFNGATQCLTYILFHVRYFKVRLSYVLKTNCFSRFCPRL